MRIIFLCLIFFCILFEANAESSKDMLTNTILKRVNEEDPFNLLTEEQLQREWSVDSSENLVQSAQSLQHSFQDVSYLEIVLITDRDTNLYAELKESLEDEVYEFPLTAFENENSELHIAKKYFVTVSKGDKQIVSEMTNAIKGYLMSDNHLISSKSIDNILLNYYDSNDLTLKLYILDLKVSVGHSYSILSDTMLDCSTSYSLGSKSYLYLDLHATCSKFGPKTVGEGQVLPNLIPSLSSNNNNNNNSLIVQLQNFIHHSIHYLLSPSLAYYPLNLFNSLHVNIIIIKDHTSTPYNLDNTIDSLKAKLSSIPLLKGQKTIEFNTFTYTTLDCDYCASVLSHSMKHYQSPSPSFAEFHLNHKSYLDSKELYYWLSHFNTFFVPESTNSVTVLPIYIFSLSQHTSSPPLLDKKHQAVSFEDMVVAVHSDSSSYYLDYVCNTHIVSVDPSKLEVPLVSASIQSIWGVPASYKSWNLVHNKSIENYLWTLHPYSLGSPFINSIQIHPLLKDIALRNLLYTNLHIALDEVNHLFSHFEEYDKEVSEVLSSSELVQFVRRWNLFQFKVENAKKYLSLNNYNSSLAFIKSLDYDIISLHNLIHSAGNKLYTYLYCEEEKTISATTFSLVNFTKILIVLSPILVMIYVFVSFSKTILFVHSSK